MIQTKNGAMAKTSSHLQNDTTVNTVMQTNDYAKFLQLAGNRNLNELHLRRLLQSIEKKDLLKSNPILVNSKFEIIDGQHRFQAAVQLKKPVYYIMVNGLNLEDVQVLNANSKNWKLEDYIDGYCKMNLTEYCFLKSLMNKTNFGISSLIAMFANNDGQTLVNLKIGKLILTHKNRGLVILEWSKEWSEVYDGTNRRSFIRALVQLYNVKGYDHKKMMQKIKYQSAKLVHSDYTKTYVAMLEEIYNYKERNEKLRFF